MTLFDTQKLSSHLWSQASKHGLKGLDPTTLTYEDTGLSTFELKTILPSTAHSLLLLFTSIKENISYELDGLTRNEKLFDIIMGHFDAAQPYKDPIVRVWNDLYSFPFPLLTVTPYFFRHGKFLLQQSDYYSENCLDVLQTSAFSILITAVFVAWLKDETQDQSLTMATLDRHIKQFDNFFHKTDSL